MPIAITARLHPDALYDAPYEDVPLDLSGYRPLGGGAKVLARDDRGILVGIGPARLRVDVWEEGTLRLRIDPEGQPGPTATETLALLESPPAEATRFAVEEEAEGVRIRTGRLGLRIDAEGGAIALCDENGQVLWRTAGGGVRFSDEPPQYAGRRFCCWSEMGDQHFFGFGGRIAPLHRAGQSVDVFSVKTGLDSGDYGGFPVPFFISTRGYGLFLNNPWPHVYFDMGRTDPDCWLLHAPGGPCDVFLFAGPRPADVVGRYTAVTGCVPPVPRWMLGFWCSSLAMTSAEAAVADARRLRREGYPCDVFVFDGPWRGGPDFAAKYVHGHQYPAEDLDWHREFGDGPGMVRQLDAMGIKTVLHLNSHSFGGATAEAGVAAGVLRRQGDEVVPRLLHAPAEKYYHDMVQPRIDEGVAAWWTDHSDRVSGELAAGLPSRNLFGPLWNRFLTGQMAESGRAGRVCLSRGGGIGSQRYAIPWPGDTRCGMDAMADDIWFMLSAGLCGFALTSADLGGFAVRAPKPAPGEPPTDPNAPMFDDENLCRRLCDCLLFMPVPRIHNNCDTIAKFPWNCSEKVQRLYRQALNERYRLTPYLYSYVLDSARTGQPLLRPMVYEQPGSADALAATAQMLIGEWLLAAPVTRAGAQTQRVWLPPGAWIDFWTGRRHEGPGHVELDAPLYELSGLPLLVRAGAIVCRQDPAMHLDDEPPRRLYVDVYPAGRTHFDLHETPEVTNHFVCDDAEAQVRVTLENRCNFERTYVVRASGRTEAAVAVDMPPGSTNRVTLNT